MRGGKQTVVIRGGQAAIEGTVEVQGGSTSAQRRLGRPLREGLLCWALEVEDFPSGPEGKVSTRNAGDPGSIPELGRSPRVGNGNPLQYSFLENSMDRGA